MRKIICDMCKKEIDDLSVIRYVRVIKIDKEYSDSEPEERPDMREKEICSICADKVKQYIMEACK